MHLRLTFSWNRLSIKAAENHICNGSWFVYQHEMKKKLSKTYRSRWMLRKQWNNLLHWYKEHWYVFISERIFVELAVNQEERLQFFKLKGVYYWFSFIVAASPVMHHNEVFMHSRGRFAMHALRIALGELNLKEFHFILLSVEFSIDFVFVRILFLLFFSVSLCVTSAPWAKKYDGLKCTWFNNISSIIIYSFTKIVYSNFEVRMLINPTVARNKVNFPKWFHGSSSYSFCG